MNVRPQLQDLDYEPVDTTTETLDELLDEGDFWEEFVEALHQNFVLEVKCSLAGVQRLKGDAVVSE
jgi:hypothetical protein